jgi:ABC-2 type transport system permease protein
MIRIIATREAAALFRSPLAWSLLAMAQFVLAFQFLAQIETYLHFADKLRAMPEAPGVTEMVVTPSFIVSAMLMLFLIPVVTMSSLSGERRSGTLALLYSSPITSWQIVAGKFIGIGALLAVVWVMVALMPLTLMWGATLDVGVYLSGLLALFVLMAASAAIGLMFSAMFTQPAVAAIMTFSVLSGLWLIDWATRLGQDASLFNYLSSLNHFQRIARGLLDSADLAYFMIIIATSLYLTTWRLNGDRKPL